MCPQQIRWPMFRHVERRASRFSEMVAQLDVDPVKLARHRAGEDYAEARTNCLHCSSAHACLFWLEASSPQSELPDFCPNLDLFLSCKRESH